MSVTSNAISSHANPMLLAQVAIPLEPPIGGVGEAPGVPLLGGGASAGEAVMAQMSLLQLSRDEPDGIREDFERALVDANKVGAREGGEFTLVVKAPLPFMQDSQKTVRVGKDGTLTLVEPSMSARPDCVLGRLGNVENYVGDGVSVNRFPTLARTVAPRVFENRGVPAQSGLGAVVATVQSVAAGHPQAVATLKKAFERERDRLLDANGAANPAREPTVKIELPTSQATTVVQAASFDARQVTQIASQVGASTLAAMSPPLQRYATARDGAYAQLKQLMAVAGDQPELRARAAKVENSLAHLDERSGRYASLAGAQAALGKFAGLPGLTDTDGTVLDRATVASKLRTVGAQVTTAAEDAGNKIEFLSDGIRGQQARYAAKVYDAQSGQVAQVLAGMDARIGQTRSAVQKSGSAPAQMQGLAGMTQARERYAAHADTWLSREYGRQLIDAGFTGQIRDGAGRPIDRKTLNQQSVQAMRGLRQDVVAFDQAVQQLGADAGAMQSPSSSASFRQRLGSATAKSSSRVQPAGLTRTAGGTAAVAWSNAIQLAVYAQGMPATPSSARSLLVRAVEQAAASYPSADLHEKLGNFVKDLLQGLPGASDALASDRFAIGGGNTGGKSGGSNGVGGAGGNTPGKKPGDDEDEDAQDADVSKHDTRRQLDWRDPVDAAVLLVRDVGLAKGLAWLLGGGVVLEHGDPDGIALGRSSQRHGSRQGA